MINDNTLLYFGSHNFSPSSWGTPIYHENMTTKINSWELGVVWGPKKGSADTKKRLMDSMKQKIVQTGCRCPLS